MCSIPLIGKDVKERCRST